MYYNSAHMAATQIIRVDDAEQVAAAAAGAAAIRAGQLVGFATETVYGIAAMATDAEAMHRLRELKSRPKRPFTVHMGDPAQVRRYVAGVPVAAEKLIARTWPGPVTLLLQTGGKLTDAKLNKAGLHKKLCSKGVIGLRCPQGKLVEAMLSAVSDPVVAPSANLVGAPSARNAQEVLATLDGKIDLLIDSGPTLHQQDSSIVLFDGEQWTVVREGVVARETLAEIMMRRIVFVCTGNTCRSPMAEGLARAYLAGRLNCQPGELSDHGWQVHSAGMSAIGGDAAMPDAIHAAKVLGANIAEHRSQALTKELINDSDMILCMTARHVAAVLRSVPSAADKVRLLDGGRDIADPIGGGPDVYGRIAKRLRHAVDNTLEESLK